MTPEQPKLVEDTPLEQPKSDAPIKEPVPKLVDITHPIWLEPVEDTLSDPKAQPVVAGSSFVFNPIRINPVINKEYLPFTPPTKDDVNPRGERPKNPQEPLSGGSTRVEQISKDFGNGVPLRMERDRYGKGKSLPKGKRSKPIGIMQGVTPYDLLEDLGKLKADITIKQLLGIAPSCLSLLQSSLVRKRLRPIVNEVTISPDPGAPTVDVVIDGIVLRGVQLDGGSSVNLMNLDTMNGLQLTGLQDTKLMLRMADQSRVKPLGILSNVKTTIAGNPYWIDYIDF